MCGGESEKEPLELCRAPLPCGCRHLAPSALSDALTLAALAGRQGSCSAVPTAHARCSHTTCQHEQHPHASSDYVSTNAAVSRSAAAPWAHRPSPSGRNGVEQWLAVGWGGEPTDVLYTCAVRLEHAEFVGAWPECVPPAVIFRAGAHAGGRVPESKGWVGQGWVVIGAWWGLLCEYFSNLPIHIHHDEQRQGEGEGEGRRGWWGRDVGDPAEHAAGIV